MLEYKASEGDTETRSLQEGIRHCKKIPLPPEELKEDEYVTNWIYLAYSFDRVEEAQKFRELNAGKTEKNPDGKMELMS